MNMADRLLAVNNHTRVLFLCQLVAPGVPGAKQELPAELE